MHKHQDRANLDFPQVESGQVYGFAANSLSEHQRLAILGNDGKFYAVPLFDLKRDPSGTISFWCNWAGGGLRTANQNDRIEVVRA